MHLLILPLCLYVLVANAGSRRPSILPVPDMFTSSSFSISGNEDGEEGDESEDEIDDEMPWRAPSEKIAYEHLLIYFYSLKKENQSTFV